MQASGIKLDEMELSQDELEAMKFLYAHMPLGDIVNMEPEPVLNLGWFNAPASRGLLMHETMMARRRWYAERLSIPRSMLSETMPKSLLP